MQFLQSQFPNGGTFNAKTYGAKGNGTANDAPAIQAAINAASTYATSNGSAVVMIPPGKYKVIDEIEIKSNITYMLYGAYIFAGDFTGNEMFRMNSTGAKDYTVGASNVVFRGGILDAKGQTAAADQSKNIFTIANCSNWRIEDVTFRNVPNWHALDINCSKDVLINNCRFEGFVDNTTGGTRGFSEAIQLDVGNPLAGPTVNVTVMACYMGPAVDGSGLGGFGKLVGSHTSDAGEHYSNIRIIGNVAQDANDSAIQGFTWSDAVIAGNVIVNPANHGIRITQDIDYVTERVMIRNNVIRDFSGGGVYLKHDSTAGDVNANPDSVARSFNHCEISGNVLDSSENGTTSAVHVISFIGGAIHGNVITDTGAHGIFVDESQKLAITSNYIQGAAQTGIQFDTGEKCTFANNFIKDVNSRGIWLANASARNHVWANYIIGANRSGTANVGSIEFSSFNNFDSGVMHNVVRKNGDGGSEATKPIRWAGTGSTGNTVAFNHFEGWDADPTLNISGTAPSPTSYGADTITEFNSAMT